MTLSLRDEANAEDGRVELESLLEKPNIGLPTAALSRMRATCSSILRPSLWVHAFRPSTLRKVRNETKQTGRRTAYLDGLRGFAALLVYILHHELWAHSSSFHEFAILEKVFGAGDPPEYYFVCLPGVRILFSGGHFAVAIFFVISGYVLSAAPLGLIQACETERLADYLGSALFRRWIRLFLPIIGVTFLWMTSWHVFNIKSSNSFTATPEKTWIDDVWRWYYDFKNFSFVFTGGPILNKYNDHTWSIPLEFRGSIVVYTAQLAFARCTTNARLCLETGLIIYFLYIVDGWYCALFAMGMLLCDLDMLAEKDQFPRILAKLRLLPSWSFCVLLFIGLYLGGIPPSSTEVETLRGAYGWYWLSFLKPQAVFDVRWFFFFWAATLIMISVPRLSWLKIFFETRFCQYLGKVSYSFYLVHGPVLWTLGDRIYAAVGRLHDENSNVVPEWNNLVPLSNAGPFGLEINFLVSQLVLLPFTLWVADIVTKMFDEPSVKVARWLFNQSTRPKRGS